jgi:hypothetical protein
VRTGKVAESGRAWLVAPAGHRLNAEVVHFAFPMVTRVNGYTHRTTLREALAICPPHTRLDQVSDRFIGSLSPQSIAVSR